MLEIETSRPNGNQRKSAQTSGTQIWSFGWLGVNKGGPSRVTPPQSGFADEKWVMLSLNLLKIASRNALDTAGALQMGQESPKSAPDASRTSPGAQNKIL